MSSNGQLGFWGRVVTPGKTVAIKPAAKRCLRVSSAALSIDSVKKGQQASLFIVIGKTKHVLCTLKGGSTNHTSLDLFLIDNTVFGMEGQGAIHLSGYTTYFQAEDSDSEEPAQASGTPPSVVEELKQRQQPQAAAAVEAEVDSSGDEEDTAALALAAGDEDDEDADEEDDEESDEESDEEAAPAPAPAKKQQPAVGQKRKADSQSPASKKKQKPASAAKKGSFKCTECPKVATSEAGLAQHAAAKHSK